jgi:hypothetical protein
VLIYLFFPPIAHSFIELKPDVLNVTRLRPKSEKKAARKDKQIWCSYSCLVLLIFAQLAGCVSTQKVQLIYPPEHSRKESLPERSNEEAGSIIPVDVVLEVFDARTDKDRVGDLRSLFGNVNGIYVSDGSISDYVKDAIELELNETGHTVLGIDNPLKNDSSLKLVVDVQRINSNFPYERKAAVLFQVTLKRKGQRQESRSYEGKGRAAFYLSTRKNFAEALAIALEDTILKMLVDLGLVERGMTASGR